MVVRQATHSTSDIDAIVHHRQAMFIDVGYPDDAALRTMAANFRPWLQKKMEATEYLTWFAVVPECAPDSSIAAGLGLWLMDWPPHMIGGGSRWRGNILNVYTEPAHRRRGMGRALMTTALEWCEANQVSPVILHASPDGRALYESLGFKPTNEMRLTEPRLKGAG
jgi:GNAT superfamily N-acetyltransferase